MIVEDAAAAAAADAELDSELLSSGGGLFVSLQGLEPLSILLDCSLSFTLFAAADAALDELAIIVIVSFTSITVSPASLLVTSTASSAAFLASSLPY